MVENIRKRLTSGTLMTRQTSQQEEMPDPQHWGSWGTYGVHIWGTDRSWVGPRGGSGGAIT